MADDEVYREAHRPQFHFTARKGWINDPNGLVFHEGEYHLFFQHNPGGVKAENMHWGHAVGPDLVHWTEFGDAIFPDELGTIWSGSAVVDRRNTAGFQKGDEKAIVCFYTSAGGCLTPKVPFTQSIAYSTDRGRAWTKYEGNPVLGNIVGANRDPKVVWHAPTEKWVMALYLDGNDYALFSSRDLKSWSRLCDVHLPGASECPDFFELPVDGDPAKTRWVFWGANGSYLLGSFDGEAFEVESGPHRSNWGANSYAAQTWSDVPESDGRRLQITWMSGGEYPGMPFTQQMSFPVELDLRTTPEGIRLHRRPVGELEGIRAERRSLTDVTVAPGENPLSGLSGELLDVRAEIEPGGAREVGLVLRGVKVSYDVNAGTLACLGGSAPLEPEDGRIRLQVLVDRTSVEVFGNDGRVSMPACLLADPDEKGLAAYVEGGEARLVSLDVCELRSVWPACRS